jgi:hypothetical protein
MAAIGYHAFSKRMHQFASSAAIYSTTTGCYGNSERKTEMPRTALMDALEKRTALRMVRSNRVAAGKAKPDPQAWEELPKLPEGFRPSPNEDLFIDYVL